MEVNLNKEDICSSSSLRVCTDSSLLFDFVKIFIKNLYSYRFYILVLK